MSAAFRLTRRRALALGLAGTGGLLLGVPLARAREVSAGVPASDIPLNAYLRIAPDGTITLITPDAEMGQGVYTSLPAILAEELDADFDRVRIEFCGFDPAFVNPMKGYQATGQSAAVRGYFEPLRKLGASARAMLIAAAARKWGVDPAQCTAHRGIVRCGERSIGYGEIAAAAAAEPAPASPTLKAPADFTLIGRRLARKDSPAKVDGSAVFASDLAWPGLLHATVRSAPAAGGRLLSIDDRDAKAMPGVRAIVRLGDTVAVVANQWWQARQAADRLQLEFASTSLIDDLSAADRGEGLVAWSSGDTRQQFEATPPTLDVIYDAPYLAHATMEPMSCVAEVTGDHCTVWAPTQGPTTAHAAAVKASGLAPDKVAVHRTFLGGGFGRRYQTDFIVQAVQISKAVAAPVKLLWSREEDMRHDFYRPMARARYRALLGEGSRIVAVEANLACGSLMERMRPGGLGGKVDAISAEGALDRSFPADHVRVTHHAATASLPIGMWRAVSHSQNGYFKESFVDELAQTAGRDPYEFRRECLAGEPRHLAVLDLAAERAGWGKPLPAGRARGIAIVEAYGSIVAQVAEVSLERGEPRVHRVVCAVDCGFAIDPWNIEAQMQSAIVYGLSAALWGEVSTEGGAVQQSNFSDYRVLRFNEMPRIETHLVKSDAAPGGIGEAGLPPIAPAVCNALFALTGRRIRRLPILDQLAAPPPS